jgi:hypothetical protein
MAQLIWDLVKDSNAFLVKRGGVAFTSDPFSVTSKNTQLGLGKILSFKEHYSLLFFAIASIKKR